jgi:hypothetical protein
MEAAKDNPCWIEMEQQHIFSRQGLVELLRQHSFEVTGFCVSFRYKAQMEVYLLKLRVN